MCATSPPPRMGDGQVGGTAELACSLCMSFRFFPVLLVVRETQEVVGKLACH